MKKHLHSSKTGNKGSLEMVELKQKGKPETAVPNLNHGSSKSRSVTELLCRMQQAVIYMGLSHP